MNDLKTKPGRPRSANKKSAADKQREYRQRLKLQIESLPSKDLACRLRDQLEELNRFNALLVLDLQNERIRSEELQIQVWQLEVKISKKSNVTKINK